MVLRLSRDWVLIGNLWCWYIHACYICQILFVIAFEILKRNKILIILVALWIVHTMVHPIDFIHMNSRTCLFLVIPLSPLLLLLNVLLSGRKPFSPRLALLWVRVRVRCRVFKYLRRPSDRSSLQDINLKFTLLNILHYLLALPPFTFCPPLTPRDSLPAGSPSLRLQCLDLFINFYTSFALFTLEVTLRNGVKLLLYGWKHWGVFYGSDHILKLTWVQIIVKAGAWSWVHLNYRLWMLDWKRIWQLSQACGRLGSGELLV